MSSYISEKKIIYSIIILLFGMIICIENNVIIQIIVFWLMYIIGIILYKIDILHPFVWFLGAFSLYSTAYPILYILNASTKFGLSREPLIWNWIAYFAFVVCFRDSKVKIEEIKKTVYFNTRSIECIIHLSTLIFILVSISISRCNLSGKNEIYATGNILYNFAFSWIYLYFFLFTFVIYINVESKTKRNRKIIMIISEVGLATILMTLYSGERDILLEYMLIVIISLYNFKWIGKKQIIFMAVIFIILFPLTSIYKYYFLTGNLGELKIDGQPRNILINFLTGEFESASKNLQILSNHKLEVKAKFMGLSYLSDLTRIIGYAPCSSLGWFNYTFYNGSSVGHGFTLVGEGYVNFGVIGIIISFSLLSRIMSYIYIESKKGIFGKIIFVCSISIFIYSLRADFANIFSPFVRHVIFPAFIVYIIKTIRIREMNK